MAHPPRRHGGLRRDRATGERRSGGDRGDRFLHREQPWKGEPAMTKANDDRSGKRQATKAESNVRESLKNALPEMVHLRRDLHRRPELAFRESGTAALIEQELRRIDLQDVRTGVAQTGLTALLPPGTSA